MTGHWIGTESNEPSEIQNSPLEQKIALITFHKLRGAHMGKRLVPSYIYSTEQISHLRYHCSLISYFMQFIMSMFQVGHFTLDNAKNNKTMLAEVEVLLHRCELDRKFSVVDHTVNCFPHVVNISTGHILKALTNEDLLIDSDGNWLEGTEFPGATPTQQTYEKAVKRDPIALAHTAVRVIWALGQHRDAFHEVIKDGNAKG